MRMETLRELAEIVDTHQIAGRGRPKMGECMGMAGVNNHRRYLRMQLMRLVADTNQLQDAAENPAFDRTGIFAALSRLPVHFGPVKPAIVGGVIRIVRKTVVVQKSNLVPHIDQRNAVVPEDNRMAEQNPLNGQGDRFFVFIDQSNFKTGKTCGRAGYATIAGLRIFLKDASSREGERKAAGVKFGEELAMG